MATQSNSTNVGKSARPAGGRHKAVACLLLVVVCVLWFAQTKEQARSANDASRLASVESLVERGTWRIDDSVFLETARDKVFLGGHFYSDKPPLFQAMAAVPYAVMHRFLGASFQVDACREDDFCTYKWLTWLMVGLPSALALMLSFRLWVHLTGSVLRSLCGAGLLAFGTMVWPYSLVFNAHLPAAAALLAGFGLVLTARHSGPLRFLAAGLLGACAISMDLTGVPLLCALVVIVFIRRRAAMPAFLVGACLPVLVTMVLDYQSPGSILPPYFMVSGYDYPGSGWSATLAATRAPANLADHFFHSLIGDRGVLAYSPLLLWTLVGLIRALRGRAALHRLESTLIGLGVLAQVLYVSASTDNYGGDAYGERYFLVWIPLIFVYAAFALPDLKRRLGPVVALLLVLTAVPSGLSAWQGAADPWETSLAPIYLALTAEAPYLSLASQVKPGVFLRGPDQVAIAVRCARLKPKSGTSPIQLPSTGHPLDVNFGGRVALRGYELPAGVIRAGEIVPMILYWESLAATDQDYIQINDLQDAQAASWGRYTRAPARAETSCWEPGEWYEDRHVVPVRNDAPAGPYSLSVGLYSPQKGQFSFLRVWKDGQPTDQERVDLGPLAIGDAQARP